jgi:hypothetical protein
LLFNNCFWRSCSAKTIYANSVSGEMGRQRIEDIAFAQTNRANDDGGRMEQQGCGTPG